MRGDTSLYYMPLLCYSVDKIDSQTKFDRQYLTKRPPFFLDKGGSVVERSVIIK